MTAPGCHAVRVTPLSWQKTRAAVYLGLLLYALGWTLQRWHLRLRAALPRRPEEARPARAVPEGPARPPAGRGAVSGPVAPVLAEAVPLDQTRDDLTVIHAGGMLLPDRPRENPDPEPFRIRPYYLRFEAEQAARRWLA